MVTINDIAKMAGVAKSTVSRYLNGGSISKKTKAKLDAIVAETGYTPNTFAQSLKAKRTNIVGTIIPRLDSYSSNAVLEGIDQELLKRQMQLVIMNSSQSVEREDEAHAGESMGRYIAASGHQRILLLSVTRTNWRTGEKESRRVELTEPLTELRLFMEESSLEVFVNQGQECFSLRYIALASDKSLSYHEDTSTANNEWTIYSLSGFKMEKLLGSF